MWGLTQEQIESIKARYMTLDMNQKLRILSIAVAISKERSMTIETAIENVLRYLKDDSVWKDPE